jgi:hypothetical protein
MLPARLAPILTGLIISGVMSFIVSGVAMFRALGMHDGFVWSWTASWLASWAVAFPSVLVVAPLARGIVARVVKKA